MKNILEIFKTIVQIDSVSGDEKKIREFIIDLIKNKKDFKFKVDKVGNLFLKNKGIGEPILFCAHLDTVEPGKNIIPLVKNGYIVSEGKTILGADNKVWVATLIDLLINEKIKRNIEIVFSVKEEVGGGIEFFPFKILKSKKAIIFDNANPIGGIVLRSPQIINFYIEIFGKAYHSSEPQKGINSLIPMIKFLNKIHLGVYKNNTTCNIGIINSGAAINTIPEKTILKGEIRSYSKKDFLNFQDKIKKQVYNLKQKFKGKIILNFDGYCPGYEFSKKDEFVEKIEKIFTDNKIKTYFLEKSGISDANILNHQGIKTIVLSDGVIDPHTTSEKIKINDLYLIKLLTKELLQKI